MKIVYCNIWDCNYKNFIICITTNGTVKKNGEGVMGAGIAKEVAEMIPYAPKKLGTHIKANGNHVGCICDNFIAFPVKHNWYEIADINLIKRSAKQLIDILNRNPTKLVVLPAPGIGNGKLSWDEVEKVIEPILGSYRNLVIIMKEEK